MGAGGRAGGQAGARDSPAAVQRTLPPGVWCEAKGVRHYDRAARNAVDRRPEEEGRQEADHVIDPAAAQPSRGGASQGAIHK